MKKCMHAALSLVMAVVSLTCVAIPAFAAGNKLTLSDLTVNSAKEPTGVDSNVYLSWILNSSEKNTNQTAYQIRVSNGDKTVFDSGKVNSQASAYVPVDVKLKPATTYKVDVTSWDNHNNRAKANTQFTSGKVNQGWDAKWITIPESYNYESPDFIFKKTFNVTKPVKKATLYGTALGCYVPFLNGSRVSDDYFAPGYTQYSNSIQYNTYDVTRQIKQGANTALTEVAPGWYTGRLGLIKEGEQWGKARALLQEIRIEYTDGSKDVIGTDDTWQYSTNGPRRFTSFFDGEKYDAAKKVGDGPFKAVSLYKDKTPEIRENTGVPVRKGEIIHPKRMANGIYDFGRNFAGIIHVKLRARSGDTIHIGHAEHVENGKLDTTSLRTAKAEVNYTCKDGEQEYEPLFTYMGFQYAQITSPDPDVVLEDVYGTELYSDIEQIGSFTTNDSRINQLQKNILTSSKANFVDIPTDCPQRDERCGWTGDISVFSPTAAYNFNLDRFMEKWLTDVRASQKKDGLIPMIVPTNNAETHLQDFYLAYMNDAVWGDVIIYVPWALYQSTGDIRFLEENYDAMTKWLGYELWQAGIGVPYIWGLGGMHYGDWLAPDTSKVGGMTRADYTSTEYMAHSADLVSQIAKILGKDSDAKKYAQEYENTKKAFQTYLVKPDGHLRRDFQSAYVLALEFNLLTPEQRQLALDDLVKNIEKNGNHLTTGFVGTPYLLPSLSDNGRTDKAYDLLFQDTCPSWLYEVKVGATSTWERWDLLKEDGTANYQQGSDSDSFNHYAYGCVGDWMYRNSAGIQPASAGYKTIRIQPLMDKANRMTSAKSSHKTPYGVVSVDWTKSGGTFKMNVTVPCNTTAQIVLPNGQTRTVGSGTYSFTCKV